MGCKNSKADKVEKPVANAKNATPHHEYRNDEDAGHQNQHDIATDAEITDAEITCCCEITSVTVPGQEHIDDEDPASHLHIFLCCC